MARGSKGKRTPSKGKKTTNEDSQEYDRTSPTTNSSSSHNLGPLAGVVAFCILIVAMFWRPSQSNETTSFMQQSHAVMENVTMNQHKVPVREEKEHETVAATPKPMPGFHMNAFHDIHTYPPNKEDLIHYLTFDDGYSVCLRQKDLGLDEYGAWHVKQLKLAYLESIANSEFHWIAESPLARKATCRILTLIHDDYEAVDKLENVMKRGNQNEIVNLTIEKVNHAWDFRTIVCLSRLTDQMVNQELTPEFQQLKYTWGINGTAAKNIAEEEPPRLIARGWTNKPDKASSFHYYENGPYSTWIRPTVRPGQEGTMPLGKHEKKASLVVRKNPCPYENSKPLLLESSFS